MLTPIRSTRTISPTGDDPEQPRGERCCSLLVQPSDCCTGHSLLLHNIPNASLSGPSPATCARSERGLSRFNHRTDQGCPPLHQLHALRFLRAQRPPPFQLKVRRHLLALRYPVLHRAQSDPRPEPHPCSTNPQPCAPSLLARRPKMQWVNGPLEESPERGSPPPFSSAVSTPESEVRRIPMEIVS